MILEFDSPAALALLLLLPAALVLAWRRGLFSKGPNTVRRSRIRGILAATTRTFMILALVLGLAGLRIKTRTNDLALIFLVDVSASMPRAQRQQIAEFINAQVQRAGARDYIGVIAFGSEPSVELAPTRKQELEGWQFEDIKSRPGLDHTDIAAALRLAAGLAPEGATPRLVLVSDGNENLESALQYAPLLSGRGIRVFTRSVRAGGLLPEVAVSAIEAPTTVAEGESFELKVEVDATTETDVKLRLFRNGSLAGDRQVHVVPSGENQFILAERPERKGFYTYRAEIEALEQDTFKENNAREAIVKVEGRPKTLYIYGDDKPSAGIVRVLRDGNFNADIASAGGIPASLAGFQDYDLVIFDNVPATRLTSGQMNLVKSYVHDLGGGFMMIGGENSFGAGGYFKTPVADVLPVSLDVRKKKHFPKLALAIVIDKSGSMNEHQGNAVKIELAKEAAIAALDSLSERDQACVITFDTEAHLALALTNVDNKLAIHNAVDEISADGGTNIYSGLEQAYNSLLGSDAEIKHIILLSDGESMEGDYPGITQAMRSANMTLSTVAVGDEADINLMQMLAASGSGRFYSTENAETLPGIFTREAFMASRSVIIEEPFVPQVTARSQAIAGVDWGSAPQLLGYVGTADRSEAAEDSQQRDGGAQSPAIVSLVSDKGDPIYADWQFGLGHAGAFTSDAKSRWAAAWMNWPGFGQFWNQALRENLRRDSVAGAIRLEASVQFDDDPNYRRDLMDREPGEFIAGRGGHISVEATDATGHFANNLALTARIIAPDLSADTRVLQQSAAGQYHGDFLADKTGPYIISIENSQAPAVTVGAVKSYSPEYAVTPEDSDLLARLSEATGGNSLDDNSVGQTSAPGDDSKTGLSDASAGSKVAAARDLFDHTDSGTIPHDIWERLVLMALLLLPLDVAVRRLSVGREDARRLRAKVHALFVSWMRYAREAPDGMDRQQGTEGMARLKTSRQRVRLRQSVFASSAPKDGNAAVAHPDRAESVEPPPDIRATVRAAGEASSQPEPSTNEVAPLATRLLDSKRKRQK
jgi:Mg-chelatase subunit ChlD